MLGVALEEGHEDLPGLPALAQRVDQRFEEVEALLEKYREGDGFVLYDTVTEPERQELSRAIDALSKEVSQVQGVIAPQ